MATNLQFIKSVSGSGVSSLSVTDCFTSDYNIYQIHTDYSSTTSTPFFLNMRLIDSGGNIITDSEYDKAELYLKSDASFNEGRQTNSSNFAEPFGEGDLNGENANAVITVFNAEDSSSFTFIQGQAAFNVGGVFKGKKYIGVHKVAETITGFHMYKAGTSGTSANITVNIYGVK
tara:strand:- start:182 stop:703 length:522 start_codon:yes stop_codon:yes gene_type:complete